MNSKVNKEDIYELEREISKLPNDNLTVKNKRERLFIISFRQKTN